ncbi:MAG: Asp-tRNA(Asn)/Glu-tRNA(Gln) amidotransferase subunit GatB [Methanomassiliicoccales archaeon]|nr:Asp-tRNA(Asn)/Glu-tRNA(Gln) amidotransferase subunit GatB [Methanomassiliicoccales archaeon]
MKIGLEIHLQLPTTSKLFCSCPTSASEPNEAICPTCLGFPGSRPRLNRKALEMGLMIAKRLGCRIPDITWFSRKTYFYPDLPKNFQITQYESPIGFDGKFLFDGKSIRILRVHLEEDPGKIKRVGKLGEEISLIDYNRSGVPLVEIVTAPDLSTPREARDFTSSLLTELRYLVGISDKDEQSVRVDANISVAEERVEVKNILGLRNLEKALEFEFVRQSKMLKAGKKIPRETRRYDEERKVTLPAREKEFEEDYGYILEPDLGVFNVGEIAKLIAIPETPLMRVERLSREYGIGLAEAKKIVFTSYALADLFEDLSSKFPANKVLSWILDQLAANWSTLEKRMTEDLRTSILTIIGSILSGSISESEGRKMLVSIIKGEEFVGTSQELDTEEVIEIICSILKEHPEIISDYKTNKRAANFVIGQVMKAFKGRCSSDEVAKLVINEIERRLSR